MLGRVLVISIAGAPKHAFSGTEELYLAWQHHCALEVTEPLVDSML